MDYNFTAATAHVTKTYQTDREALQPITPISTVAGPLNSLTGDHHQHEGHVCDTKIAPRYRVSTGAGFLDVGPSQPHPRHADVRETCEAVLNCWGTENRNVFSEHTP